MDLRETPEQQAFRAEVRGWLEQNLPEGWDTDAYDAPETAEERMRFGKWWQRKLHDGGWAGLYWPREYGGRELGVWDSVIWSEEYSRVRGPNMIQMSIGPTLVGPTLIAHGADWQKKRFLEKILVGEEVWCQGFSEPNAGSDLASLRTRAEVQGDELVVTGQKIWTSFAQYAQWCILVVRTDADVAKHKGLTFLLVDMSSPGISVRPLIEMTGHAWFNEVFFDQVRVPRENVVGEINGGWHIVITTLTHERGSSAQHARLASELELLLRLARDTPYRGGFANRDPRIRQRLAQHAIDVQILKGAAYRNATVIDRDGVPGPEGSILKLAWSEIDQRFKQTASDILGPYGLLPEGEPHAFDDGYWAYELLWSRAGTIYAGTSEIQRNIISERVLGLPRE
jgi:alkylation response protein AidB-like acyl-CoA dehydrogenase